MPAEHYVEAERLLQRAEQALQPGVPITDISALAAVAHAHAALALVPDVVAIKARLVEVRRAEVADRIIAELQQEDSGGGGGS